MQLDFINMSDSALSVMKNLDLAIWSFPRGDLV